MDFITIGQYFYKLQSALFILLIAPLMVFTAVYFFSAGISSGPGLEYYVIIPAAVVLDWIAAMIIFNKKIKSVRNQQGLGAKLEKYFKLAVIRLAIISASSLLLALGLYLSGSDVFTALYLVVLGFSAALWPTGRRVSDDLRLRGDERQMVYFKKDNP